MAPASAPRCELRRARHPGLLACATRERRPGATAQAGDHAGRGWPRGSGGRRADRRTATDAWRSGGHWRRRLPGPRAEGGGAGERGLCVGTGRRRVDGSGRVGAAKPRRACRRRAPRRQRGRAERGRRQRSARVGESGRFRRRSKRCARAARSPSSIPARGPAATASRLAYALEAGEGDLVGVAVVESGTGTGFWSIAAPRATRQERCARLRHLDASPPPAHHPRHVPHACVVMTGARSRRRPLPAYSTASGKRLHPAAVEPHGDVRGASVELSEVDARWQPSGSVSAW